MAPLCGNIIAPDRTSIIHLLFNRYFMKKLILAFLISTSFVAKTYAFLPLPNVVSDAQPGGGVVAAMRAQQELQREYMEIQMMREQVAMMEQQRAIIAMQAMQQNMANHKTM